jgi:hypothetical protein
LIAVSGCNFSLVDDSTFIGFNVNHHRRRRLLLTVIFRATCRLLSVVNQSAKHQTKVQFYLFRAFRVIIADYAMEICARLNMLEIKKKLLGTEIQKKFLMAIICAQLKAAALEKL